METIIASDFRARCFTVLDRVRATGERLVILKRGQPVAEIGPVVRAGAEYPQFELRGTVTVCGDIVSPAVPEDHWESLGRCMRSSLPMSSSVAERSQLSRRGPKAAADHVSPPLVADTALRAIPASAGEGSGFRKVLEGGGTQLVIQLSTVNPGTLRNSDRLWVMSGRSSTSACAAIQRSFGPMMVPRRERCSRRTP